jgi:hypothetical protein
LIITIRIELAVQEINKLGILIIFNNSNSCHSPRLLINKLEQISQGYTHIRTLISGMCIYILIYIILNDTITDQDTDP